MPNHVHVLIEQAAGWPLAKVVQSWKRHTAREINQLGNPGAPSCTRLLKEEMPSATRRSQNPLWQRDYWDRYIRDERHYAAAKEYIEQNPVKAGLVTVAGEWSWGSARLEVNLNNAE
jgi:REP element-mobilizing transposase RayT